jgi:hypothetical protein
MKLHRAAVLVSALLVSGCFPYHFTARAGISGVVVDSASSMPIPNATISLRDRPGRSAASAYTDADGSFLIAPRLVWGIYIVPMDVFPYRTDATISALGYESVSLPVLPNPRGERVVSLGRIQLRSRTSQ